MRARPASRHSITRGPFLRLTNSVHSHVPRQAWTRFGLPMPLGRSRPAHVVSHHLGSYSALRLRVYCAPHPDIGLALVSDPSTHRLARKLEPCQGFIPCANTPRRSPLAGSRTASPRPSSLLPLNRHCIAEHRNAQHKCGLVFTSLERTADGSVNQPCHNHQPGTGQPFAPKRSWFPWVP